MSGHTDTDWLDLKIREVEVSYAGEGVRRARLRRMSFQEVNAKSNCRYGLRGCTGGD